MVSVAALVDPPALPVPILSRKSILMQMVGIAQIQKRGHRAKVCLCNAAQLVFMTELDLRPERSDDKKDPPEKWRNHDEQ